MVVLKHPKLSIAIVIVKMIMFVVTQLLVNVFVKQHFFCWLYSLKAIQLSSTLVIHSLGSTLVSVTDDHHFGYITRSEVKHCSSCPPHNITAHK
jgi:hypothetical protein